MVTPESLAASGTEHGNQAALFCWAAYNMQKYPMLRWMFAIPNGGFRTKAQAGQLKAEGVKSGVSDVFLPYSVNGIHGLFIEMKKPKADGKAAGKESDKQKEFGAAMGANGYAYVVCFTWDQASNYIETYLEGRW